MISTLCAAITRPWRSSIAAMASTSASAADTLDILMSNKSIIADTFGGKWNPDEEPEKRDDWKKAIDGRAVTNALSDTTWQAKHITAADIPTTPAAIAALSPKEVALFAVLGKELLNTLDPVSRKKYNKVYQPTTDKLSGWTLYCELTRIDTATAANQTKIRCARKLFSLAGRRPLNVTGYEWAQIIIQAELDAEVSGFALYAKKSPSGLLLSGPQDLVLDAAQEAVRATLLFSGLHRDNLTEKLVREGIQEGRLTFDAAMKLLKVEDRTEADERAAAATIGAQQPPSMPIGAFAAIPGGGAIPAPPPAAVTKNQAPCMKHAKGYCSSDAADYVGPPCEYSHAAVGVCALWQLSRTNGMYRCPNGMWCTQLHSDPTGAHAPAKGGGKGNAKGGGKGNGRGNCKGGGKGDKARAARALATDLSAAAPAPAPASAPAPAPAPAQQQHYAAPPGYAAPLGYGGAPPDQ